MTKGRVYLIGAGCGDWELITVKGLRRLQLCDCVVYDRLISEKLLEYVPQGCKKIYVGKQSGHHSKTQDEINEIIVEEALNGKTVARLKGGDPFVFGRGGEEVQALQSHGIPYEIISGISSSIAVPSHVGIPVTHRSIARSFHVITGHTVENLPENLNTLANLKGTLIFLMSLGNLETICDGLISNGKDPHTPSAVISNGTTPNEKLVRGELSNVAELARLEGLTSPSILVVGETAKLDFKSTIVEPLQGKNIAITGTDSFTTKLERKISKLGGNAIKVNHMEIVPKYENIPKDFSEYTHIVFTSTNGIDTFFRYLKDNHLDVRNILNKKFAVVGNSTADTLATYGIYADIVPEKFTSMELANEIVKRSTIEDNYLILRASNGSPVLTEILTAHGLKFHDVKLYDTISNSEKLSKVDTNVDYIVFGSSQGVREFFKYKTLPPSVEIFAIGEVCKNTLESLGLPNTIHMADSYNVDGIVNKMLDI